MHLDTIAVNSSNYKSGDKIKTPQAFDNYVVSWGADCICGMSGTSVNVDKRYSNLLFLKKTSKQYELLGGTAHLNGILLYIIIYVLYRKLRKLKKQKISMSVIQKQ